MPSKKTNKKAAKKLNNQAKKREAEASKPLTNPQVTTLPNPVPQKRTNPVQHNNPAKKEEEEAEAEALRNAIKQAAALKISASQKKFQPVQDKKEITTSSIPVKALWFELEDTAL